jgi:hypothetical protein
MAFCEYCLSYARGRETPLKILQFVFNRHLNVHEGDWQKGSTHDIMHMINFSWGPKTCRLTR